MPSPHHTPVLIVGAGLAGLTAATLLAWRGVPCLLVERRPSMGRHPRARGINPRSLELLRGVPGLEDDLSAVSPAAGDFTIIIAESVAGRVFRTLVAPGQIDGGGRAISTIDLVGPGFVLFAGPDGAAWITAAQRHALAAFRTQIDFICDAGDFVTRTGLGEAGALLVRPDGFIAWRRNHPARDPGMVLDGVLARVLCRGNEMQEHAA